LIESCFADYFFFSSKFFWERNYYLIGRLAKNLILETICLFHFVRVLPRENVETKKSNQKFIFCLSPLFLVQLESVMRQNIRRLSFQYLFISKQYFFWLDDDDSCKFLSKFLASGFRFRNLPEKGYENERYILCDKYSL
jgi:hypothetical protein